jgi:8-oxo-dGTP pyrophosphatase MutT (NUDIX family)
MQVHELKTRLIQALDRPLPGLSAHRRMAIPGRYIDAPIPETARKAAVLILFYSKLDRAFTSLIRRQTLETDRHSGQISFPGGKMESFETNPVQTALREAREEIGVDGDLEILGSLTPLYIPVSNFHVYPIIAWSEKHPSFSIQPEEVDELIELDLDLLFNPDLKAAVDIPVLSSLVLEKVPVYEMHGMVIWGATAMMLSELEMILASG